MRLNAQDIEVDSALDLGPARLTIHQDLDADNPWTNWDCMTPLAWTSGGRHATLEVIDSGDDILRPLGSVSTRWTSRHWRALCGILDLNPKEEDGAAREEARDYEASLGLVRKERFAAALESMSGGAWPVDYLDALAAIWTLRGIPALSFQRNGYSQGDSVLGLLVATPEHAARCGFSLKRPRHDVAASLKGDADLLGAWAFGDVYGFTIEDGAGETLDSCWGFYGAPYGPGPCEVLEAAEAALRGLAPEQAAQAQAAAHEARAAFLRAREEARAARFVSPGGALCEIVQAALRDLAKNWRAAKKEARAWAALAESTGAPA